MAEKLNGVGFGKVAMVKGFREFLLLFFLIQVAKSSKQT